MSVTENEVAADGVGMFGGEPVRAAGAVLWRAGTDGPEIAVVHRPRYDDWSLPKGKLDNGELPAHAAVREVAEETGFSCVLSRWLGRVDYRVPRPGGGSAPKVVDYFAARADGGSFTPNDEVDELRWLDPAAARTLLTYPHDADLLDAFLRLPVESATVLLVRHAKAGKRSDWDGDDALRPLTEAGRRQRDALRSLLLLFGPRRIYSAPRVRCEQTVDRIAADLGIGITAEPLFSEEGYRTDPDGAVRRLLRVAAGPGTALVCSQGGVIPDLVGRLARRAGLELGEVASKKGSVWTLTFSADGACGNGDGPALRLAAADYLADPLG
ncbi:NUDIX hydrolase [Saccharopolyspora subtropica]|uniref:NUDIX hydrolase n=1 Tax=Saccharopolyspora thermophila TaxID=89367 RepID=A0A917N7G5_9PSEU|nr:NUDIX hydrolase [Saccharopolyspora subtropica]GGI73320.1 NUDIX hydrolase [Saccharopolyspora subtropica]